MAHQFRAIGVMIDDQRWVIDDPDECHHLQKVIRKKTGDQIEVCDGKGRWAVGLIVEMEKHLVHCETKETFVKESPTKQKLVVAVCAMRPSEMDDIVEQLSEIGADELWIFPGVHTPGQWLSESVERRWKKIARNSLKQAKRFFFLETTIFPSQNDFLSHLMSNDRLFVLDSEGEKTLLDFSDCALSRPSCSRDIFVVGNEGGLDIGLRTGLKNLNCSQETIRLSDFVLRARHVPVIVAAVWQMIRLNSARDKPF